MVLVNNIEDDGDERGVVVKSNKSRHLANVELEGKIANGV